MNTIARTALVTFAGALLSIGCSGRGETDVPPVATEDSLEIFSWWSASGEEEALDALLGVFHDTEPAIGVINAADKNSRNARDTLKARLNAGDPPDSFQAISGVDLMHWVDLGKMEPITDLADQHGWSNAFITPVTELLSRDGQLYAVPINIERDNNLYYNVELLNRYGVAPPRSLAEFYTACETLQAQSVTPLAIPAQDWVLALVAFETLMPALNGGEFYLDFMRGKVDPKGPELRAFFEELAKVLRCSNVTDPDNDTWESAAEQLYRGDAGMLVMGDWAKGYLERERKKDMNGPQRPGWKPGVDFDVVPGLGSDGYYTFNSAVFGLPVGAQHPQAAKAFLATVGSQVAQEAFNPVKGSVPARSDVDLGHFDEMAKNSVADFTAAVEDEKLLPGYASLTSLDFQEEISTSLLVFAVGGDRAFSLDPAKVSEDETIVPALDVDYIVAKVAANYPLLTR
jgi:glucose/mannose transport system substrate-binding protein